MWGYYYPEGREYKLMVTSVSLTDLMDIVEKWKDDEFEPCPYGDSLILLHKETQEPFFPGVFRPVEVQA